MSEPTDVERAVHERYSRAADSRAEELCCPVKYDPRYLEAIPPEILQRDYGCGDPSRYLRPGETVLNLVRSDDKQRLFDEIHRALERGGRAVISDIVCDEDVPPALQADPELWSGCISGA